MIDKDNFIFDDIVSCEKVGMFEDEYVYDIEMEDRTHTFIANDILVHNSNFLNLGSIMKHLDLKGQEPIDFILNFHKIKLRNFYINLFEKYASKNNTENIQDFELEKISRYALFVAKKHYVTNDIWKEPNIHYEENKEFTYKGIHVVSTSIPIFLRDKMKEAIKIIFKEGKNLNSNSFIKLVKKWKDEYKLGGVDEICFLKSITDYEKYVINDRDRIHVKKKCPIHLRAAAIHNFMLNQDKKYKNKYQLIKSKDRVRFYYTKNPSASLNVFGFIPGSYPTEINPPEINFDLMFSKGFISPINTLLECVVNWQLPENLVIMQSLF